MWCTLHNAIMPRFMTPFSYCSCSSHIPLLSSSPSAPDYFNPCLCADLQQRLWVSTLCYSVFQDARCPLLAVSSNDVRASLAPLWNTKDRAVRWTQTTGFIVRLQPRPWTGGGTAAASISLEPRHEERWHMTLQCEHKGWGAAGREEARFYFTWGTSFKCIGFLKGYFIYKSGPLHFFFI